MHTTPFKMRPRSRIRNINSRDHMLFVYFGLANMIEVLFLQCDCPKPLIFCMLHANRYTYMCPCTPTARRNYERSSSIVDVSMINCPNNFTFPLSEHICAFLNLAFLAKHQLSPLKPAETDAHSDNIYLHVMPRISA